MKWLIVYAGIMTMVAVGAGGVGLGYLLFGSDDDKATEVVQVTERPTTRPRPQATEYVPQLTGAEAAVKAKTFLVTETERLGFTPDQVFQAGRSTCESVDFNTEDRAWIVECESGGTLTFSVDDVTGIVSVVR